jgi:hypothetical protein
MRREKPPLLARRTGTGENGSTNVTVRLTETQAGLETRNGVLADVGKPAAEALGPGAA